MLSAQTGLSWDAIVDMPPKRIEYLQKGIETRLTIERINMFRAVAATISGDYARNLTKD